MSLAGDGCAEPRNRVTAPHGAWRSPLSAGAAAAGGTRFGGVAISGAPDARRVWWAESLPESGGRMTIMCAVAGAGPVEVLPGEVWARCRVNEYGGGVFWVQGDQPFWVDENTQRIHRAPPVGGRPAWERHGAITAMPPVHRGWRYAAGMLTPDGEWVLCERELHVGDGGEPLTEPVNDIVAIPTAAAAPPAQHRLVGPGTDGAGDFSASPVLSPDGSTLAWLRWDHPDMPWDAAELWAGRLVTADGGPRVTDARRVAGGREGGAAHDLGRSVSVCLPEWSPDGHLWWCDDASDWWHLRTVPTVGLPGDGEGDRSPLVDRGAEPVTEEVGEPRWVSGGHRYGFTDDGRVVFAASADGLDSAWVLDPATGRRARLPGPEFTHIEHLVVTGSTVALVAGTPLRPTSVWRVELDDGEAVDLRGAEPPLDPGWISGPVPVTFDTGDSERAHALVYLPTSADHSGPVGELPPLVVRIHGGPTAAARAEFSTSVQFWTTRGFAVADVNYRGSTGFGRRYRDLLRKAWGDADVEDCIAVTRHLADVGLIDGERCVIRGGSAGGFTALAAVCFQADRGHPGAFAAACSLYGVTDLAALAADTHKFESRYLDGLVGELPEAREVYRARSPLHHADRLDRPVLLLQGSEDKVVPPSQAEVLVDALRSNGVPHAYVLFQGEGHGFSNAPTVVRALGLELAFYGQVLGFTPSDTVPPLEL
jgi:dipeptidyl aminopeptidase/acylaminoacyl peptidase